MMHENNLTLAYALEKRVRECGGNPQRTPVCGNCRFWIRHYMKESTRVYVPLPIGHCIGTKITKHRRESDTCDAYQERKHDVVEAQLM